MRRSAGSVPQFSFIPNKVISYIYEQYGHLSSLGQPLLSRANLKWFADAVYAKVGALTNC